jgi:hypothetical protein
LNGYEATFRENGANAEVSPHLTAEDLKELGVAGVGHRRQLLVAIAALHPEGTPAARLSRRQPVRRRPSVPLRPPPSIAR